MDLRIPDESSPVPGLGSGSVFAIDYTPTERKKHPIGFAPQKPKNAKTKKRKK